MPTAGIEITPSPLALSVSGALLDGVLGTGSAMPIMDQPGIGDGRSAFFFDGGDYVNVYTSSLASRFDGSKGWLLQWVRIPDAAVWADATVRRFLSFFIDANNYIMLEKHSTANQIDWLYNAGGTVKTRTDTSLAASTNWFLVSLTWDKTADEVRAYLNGAQVGATFNSLGTWAGTPTATGTVLGALNTTPSNPHKGLLAHAAVGAGRALTPAQVAAVYAAGAGDMQAAIMSLGPTAYWMLDDDFGAKAKSEVKIEAVSSGDLGYHQEFHGPIILNPKKTKRDIGGFYDASWEIRTSDKELALELLTNGLGREVRFFNEKANLDWEGYLNRVTIDRRIARATAALDRMENSVWTRYTPLSGGAVTRSTVKSHAVSVARFGTKQGILNGGQIDLTEADQKAQAALNLSFWPKPDPEAFVFGQRGDDDFRILFKCLGWWHTLNWLVYNQTVTSGTMAASAFIDVLLNTCGTFFASRDIQSNGTSVTREHDADQRGGEIVEAVCELGDSNNRVWVAGGEAERRFYFREGAPATALT